MTRLAVLLGILAIGLALLLFNHGSGETMGMSNDDFGRFIYLAPLAILVGAGALTTRGHVRRNLTYLAIWTLAALVFVGVYVYRDQARQVGSRVLAELVPGHSVVLTGINGQSEVLIRRTQGGHFAVNAELDGHKVAC